MRAGASATREAQAVAGDRRGVAVDETATVTSFGLASVTTAADELAVVRMVGERVVDRLVALVSVSAGRSM